MLELAETWFSFIHVTYHYNEYVWIDNIRGCECSLTRYFFPYSTRPIFWTFATTRQGFYLSLLLMVFAQMTLPIHHFFPQVDMFDHPHASFCITSHSLAQERSWNHIPVLPFCLSILCFIFRNCSVGLRTVLVGLSFNVRVCKSRAQVSHVFFRMWFGNHPRRPHVWMIHLPPSGIRACRFLPINCFK